MSSARGAVSSASIGAGSAKDQFGQGQCYVRLPFADLAGRRVRLEDLLSSARYEREGSDLVSRGLYLDLPPWGFHAFAMTAA
jgi:hypothetical protein